jgi:hypothetical protein
MRIIVTIVGILALAMGLIWVGQGTGYLTYTPPHMHPSFMIGDMHWTYYGGALALVGLLLVYLSRRGA